MARKTRNSASLPKPDTPDPSRAKTANLKPVSATTAYFEPDNEPVTPKKKAKGAKAVSASARTGRKTTGTNLKAVADSRGDLSPSPDEQDSPASIGGSDGTLDSRDNSPKKVSPAKRASSPSLVEGVKRVKIDSASKLSSVKSRKPTPGPGRVQESPTRSIKAVKRRYESPKKRATEVVIDMTGDGTGDEDGGSPVAGSAHMYIDDEAEEGDSDSKGGQDSDAEMPSDRETKGDVERRKRNLAKLVAANPDLLAYVAGLNPEIKSGADEMDTSGSSNSIGDEDGDTYEPAPFTSRKSITFVPGTTQSELSAPFKRDPIRRGPMNSELWDKTLWDMYEKYDYPDRIVGHMGKSGVRLLGPSFDEWAAVKKHLPLMLKLLEFTHNGNYVNLSRVSPSELIVHDTDAQHPKPPLRYIAWKNTTNPALCVSLVEVREAHLFQSESVTGNKGGTTRHYEKKSVIANLFPQEQELFNSVVGSIYDVSQIILPIWSADKRGLTFGTKLSRAPDVPERYGGNNERSGNYQDDIVAVPAGRIQPSIWANGTMPVFDARKRGFDLSKALATLKDLEPLRQELPDQCVGAMFYTVTDNGAVMPNIELNFQAFMLLATQEDIKAATKRK